MKKIEVLSYVNQDIETVRKSFNKELFTFLSPPFMPMKVVRFDGILKGSIFEIDLSGGLLPTSLLQKLPMKLPSILNTKWRGEVVEYGETQEGFYFVDEALDLPFPLTKWRHLHRIIPNPQKGGVDILDHIEFSCLHSLLEIPAYAALLPVFVYRKKRYQEFYDGLTKN